MLYSLRVQVSQHASHRDAITGPEYDNGCFAFSYCHANRLSRSSLVARSQLVTREDRMCNSR